MTILIQWIDCGDDHWESAEGRFAIWKHGEHYYVRDRINRHPVGQDPPGESCGHWDAKVLQSADLCKHWAHDRLTKYWRV